MTAVTERRLHPGAWWLWALGLATAASRTTNPLLLILVIAVAALVVAVRRSDSSWSRGFRYYLWAGLFVMVLRVAFRVVLGGVVQGTVLLTLPEVTMPAWMTGFTLGGPVTVEAVVGGLYDGLRLAAMLVCVGAANALADPKRLLRSVPRALHDLGAAVVVAIGFAPQLVESVQRVRRAQRLRGHAGGGARLIRRTVMPVLEGATARALVLAGSMESRGLRAGPPPTAATAPSRPPWSWPVWPAWRWGLYGLMDGNTRGGARHLRSPRRPRPGGSRVRHGRSGSGGHRLPTRPVVGG